MPLRAHGRTARIQAAAAAFHAKEAPAGDSSSSSMAIAKCPALRCSFCLKQQSTTRPYAGYVAAGGSCTDHPLPSGSEKKQKRPQGNS